MLSPLYWNINYFFNNIIDNKYTKTYYFESNVEISSSFETKFTCLYLLTPWSRVLPEKLKRFNYSRNSSHFMEPEGSSPHSEEPAICPYPEPD
jgi:hypothetical protein